MEGWEVRFLYYKFNKLKVYILFCEFLKYLVKIVLFIFRVVLIVGVGEVVYIFLMSGMVIVNWEERNWVRCREIVNVIGNK